MTFFYGMGFWKSFSKSTHEAKIAKEPVSGYYPYPFIDVRALGYQQALLNAAGVAAVFLALSLLFVALAKQAGKNLN